MSASCLLSARVGDVIHYYGGRHYQDKIIGKCQLARINQFPAGSYPIVGLSSENRRVVHPHYYTISKIVKSPYDGMSS